MKKTRLKLLLALLALAAPLWAQADLIYYEGFNYPNGNITNDSLTIGGTTYSMIWSNFSGSGLHDMIVNNGHLEVSTTGNAVTSRADDDCRFLALTNNSIYTNTVQMLYASFTIICTNLPNGPGSYFASFYSNSKGYCGRMLAFTNGTVLPNTWRLAVSGNSSSATTAPANGGYPLDLALNTPYQVVEELDPVTLDAATIWINPIDVNQTGLSSTETHYTSSDSFGFATTTPVNSYSFRQASSFGNGFWIITNLAVATTFAEAATNVWATNALTPVIVLQPVSVTNYPGSSFNLSVLADGQGLGELDYQWRENGAPFSNPGGDTNILPFASVPANSGTNVYDVVVTTPYGLSVTSSPVTVAINTTPAPPAFTQKPANIAVYQGQNAIFTASVLTPGNPMFTWYSNSVPITAGVNSSGYTSTLEIDNVTSANAASYYVAVTNDVYPTGIVSPVVTLSVKVPAAVTIGYLHTLVDPNSFQATNTPPSIAYQVTGIVTTYTNLTTGDTSSYYLQDASGGINIFVTGGSTFRPQQGDVLTFTGVLSSYTSGLELYADATAASAYPFTSFIDWSNNIAALPAPRPISYAVTQTNKAYANTNLGGLLVQISDVHFGTNAGTMTSTTANTTVTITNSAGQPFNLFFPDLDADVAGQTLPNYAYTVSGVLYSQGGVVTNTIVVTRWADIVTNPPTTDLGIALAGPGYVFAGSNIVYTITVTNLGPLAGSSLVVTDTVPAGATFVSASGGGAVAAGTVSWSISTLLTNASSNLTLSVSAPAGASITNIVGVTSALADTNLANNVSAAVITTVAPKPSAGTVTWSSTGTTISWNAVAGPTYSILWSTNVTGPYAAIATGLTTSPYTDTSHAAAPIGFYKISSP